MRPRIFGQIDGIAYDEAFENSQDGWNVAWQRWQELSGMSAESGVLTFEYCGHSADPIHPCSLVQQKTWGEHVW